MGIQIEYTHNWLAVDPSVIDRARSDSVQFSGTHASLWSISANGVYRFEGNRDMVPWLTVGGGFYKRNLQFTQDTYTYYIPPVWDWWWGWIGGGWVQGESIVGERSDSGPGFNAGIGVDFPIEGSSSLFLEVRYHRAFLNGVDMQVIPVMAGLRW